MMNTYRPDSAGTAELLRSSDMQQGVSTVADLGAEYLRSIAPVATGAYRDSVDVEPMEGWDGRAGAAILVGVDYGYWVEQDSHPLAQTADWLEGQP